MAMNARHSIDLALCFRRPIFECLPKTSALGFIERRLARRHRQIAGQLVDVRTRVAISILTKRNSVVISIAQKAEKCQNGP